MSKRTHLLALWGLLLSSTASAAGEITVQTTLSESKVLVGDVVSLQVQSVARVNGDIQVQMPRVEGLTELSRSTSEGTSISWSSGGGQQITRTQTLSIELQADAAGTLQIPAVVARVGSFTARSKPSVLVVIGQEALTQQASKAEAGRVAPPDPNEQNLFVRYRLDKSEAYLGEQVLLDLEVFANARRNFSIEEVPGPPELDGFWKEIVYKPDRLTRRVETVAGRRYHVYRVWRVALFGLTAGERTLPPVRLSFSSGSGFFSSGRKLRVRTKPVTLSINPLPTEGRPRDFVSTNVGAYRLTTSVDAKVVPAGKAVLLKVALSGAGNIDNAKLPELPPVDGFRAFPPNVKTDSNGDISGVRGTKAAEILLMPTRGGRLEIPSLTVAVFDPGKAAYVPLSAPSIPVLVKGEPAPAPAATIAKAPSAPDEREQVELRALHMRADLSTSSEPPYRTPSYLAALIAPGALFLLLLLFERIVALTRRQTPAHRRRAVAKDAKARLQQARAEAEAGRLAEAYSAFVDALFTLGSQRLQVALQGLTTEQVSQALRAQGASEDLAARIAKELETADYARFAHGALDGASKEDVLARWEAILSEVEALEPNGGAS